MPYSFSHIASHSLYLSHSLSLSPHSLMLHLYSLPTLSISANPSGSVYFLGQVEPYSDAACELAVMKSLISPPSHWGWPLTGLLCVESAMTQKIPFSLWCFSNKQWHQTYTVSSGEWHREKHFWRLFIMWWMGCCLDSKMNIKGSCSKCGMCQHH